MWFSMIRNRNLPTAFLKRLKYQISELTVNSLHVALYKPWFIVGQYACKPELSKKKKLVEIYHIEFQQYLWTGLWSTYMKS
jgi:hypothetical protein